MTKRIQVPESAVRTREQILAAAVVAGGFVWVTCWNCNGTGDYPSSMDPPGKCRLYCWKDRTPQTYGRLPMLIDNYVKREQAHDRREYRFEVTRPEREAAEAAAAAAEAARLAAQEAERIAREQARLAELATRRHIGAIGERVSLTVTAERVTRFDGYMGKTRYLVRFRDAEQNLLISWMDCPPFQIDRAGDPVHGSQALQLRGTVKSHDRFRDEPQTVLLRVKCEPIAEQQEGAA